MAAAPQKPLTGSAPGLSAMTNLAMIYCKAPFDPELSSGTVDPTFWGDCKILCTEARVWSVCRTPDQIVNNIKSVSPNANGLEGYWKMTRTTSRIEDGKTVFEDLSGNGNDLSTTVTISAWPGAISAAFFLCEIHKTVDGDNKICNFARTRNNCL